MLAVVVVFDKDEFFNDKEEEEHDISMVICGEL